MPEDPLDKLLCERIQEAAEQYVNRVPTPQFIETASEYEAIYDRVTPAFLTEASSNLTIQRIAEATDAPNSFIYQLGTERPSYYEEGVRFWENRLRNNLPAQLAWASEHITINPDCIELTQNGCEIRIAMTRADYRKLHDEIRLMIRSLEFEDDLESKTNKARNIVITKRVGE